MSSPTREIDAPEAELIELERARCLAVTNADVGALDALNGAELTYIHADGRVDDLASHLHSVGSSRLTITRGDDLAVRLHGDIAVMTGELHATLPPRNGGTEPVTVVSRTLQVWVRHGQSWKLSAFAGCAQMP